MTPVARRAVVDSRFLFAFLHEAVLRSAGQGLAVFVDRLGRAGVAFALLDKAGLGCAGQGLAVLIDGLAYASVLRHRHAESEYNECECDQQLLHGILLGGFGTSVSSKP